MQMIRFHRLGASVSANVRRLLSNAACKASKRTNPHRIRKELIMRAVIQRVKNASVAIDGNTVGSIEKGFLVLLGVADSDTEEDLAYMVKKITNMRIFEDENEKMNLALKDVNGELLIISQFTLYANTKKGNRPSFIEAGAPDFSKKMYLEFIRQCRALGFKTEEGEFGADMKVSLINDGPVTIILDSAQR